METTLLISQIIISILLISCILLQAQGSGLGAAWGGGGETYHTRRGVEKVLFIITVICAVLFAVSSVALLMIR